LGKGRFLFKRVERKRVEDFDLKYPLYLFTSSSLE
jgi:hypothetical protein